MRCPGIFYSFYPVTFNGTRLRADVTELAIELQRVGTYNWRQKARFPLPIDKGGTCETEIR